jgi:hypothetical protein
MVGWAGIFTRQWYAAPHFIEPWSEVATYAVQSVRRHGDFIVSNSPSFRFYLDYLLMPAEKARVFNVTQWLRATPSPPLTVLFVEGVNQNQNLQTVQLEAKLRSECALLESEHLVPDSGSDLKLRFFPQFREPPFRIRSPGFAALRGFSDRDPRSAHTSTPQTLTGTNSALLFSPGAVLAR